MYDDDVQKRTRKAKKRPPRFKVDKGASFQGIARIGAATAAAVGGEVNGTALVRNVEDEADDEDEEPPVPQLSLFGGSITLLISVTLLEFNTQYATDNLQGLLEQAGLTQRFVGYVIIPILSNDPVSIKMAMLDKMDMSIALTLERCMQTALMVVPLVVLIAWAMSISDMSLEFDGFTIAALFASIIIVTYVVQEGKSN